MKQNFEKIEIELSKTKLVFALLFSIIFVILSISSAGFPGILVYLVLWILLPKKPQSLEHSEQPHIRNLN